MNKGSPPPEPDYSSLAQQQGDNNLAVSKQNNPNVVSPYGTQTYYDKSTDPATYQKTLENQIADLTKSRPVWNNSDWRIANGFMNGENASERGAQWFTNTTNGIDTKITDAQRALDAFKSTGVVPSDTQHPTLIQKFSPEQQALYDQENKIKGLLGGLGEQGANALQGVVGKSLDLSGLPPMPGNADATRSKVYDAMMSRVNEDSAQSKDNVNSNLVAAGFRPGSQGYDDRMNLENRQYNDARNQAMLASGQEASRDFGMDTQRRAQGLSELLAQRQTPLNEINALTSGSQTQNPFAMPGYAPPNAQPAPTFQAGQLVGNYNTDVYNAQQQAASNFNQGLFSLGTMGLMGGMRMSDRRLKSNIRRLCTHQSGIGWYAYDIFGRHEQGVMADEVETVMPEAVMTHESGYKMVDYGRLTWPV